MVHPAKQCRFSRSTANRIISRGTLILTPVPSAKFRPNQTDLRGDNRWQRQKDHYNIADTNSIILASRISDIVYAEGLRVKSPLSNKQVPMYRYCGSGTGEHCCVCTGQTLRVYSPDGSTFPHGCCHQSNCPLYGHFFPGRSIVISPKRQVVLLSLQGSGPSFNKAAEERCSFWRGLHRLNQSSVRGTRENITISLTVRWCRVRHIWLSSL